MIPVTLLKNEDGDYYIKIPKEAGDELGLQDGQDFNIFICENGLEFGKC